MHQPARELELGVQAGAAGGCGLVVGIARHGDRQALYRGGADVVLNDVGELDLGARRDDPWKLVFEGFDPAVQARRETLMTLSNGYMGVRGLGGAVVWPRMNARRVSVKGSVILSKSIVS